ncbi:unnamed protein product [Mesocestoides corti]|nr:unnamed protein product [Mesocestoides corti]
METTGRSHGLSPGKDTLSQTFPGICNSQMACSASSVSSSDQTKSSQNEIENIDSLVSKWDDVRFIAISGKRKSGKDYFAKVLHDEIQEKLRLTAVIVHISEPIKRAFAEEHNLDLSELMSSSSYKERYRRQMVRWGEKLRRSDATVFCRKALQYLDEDYPVKPSVVIIADCRRPSDLEYFSSLNKSTPLLHLRVVASPATRKARGWTYSSGIDNAETECALDTASFDVLVVNESKRTLDLSLKLVKRALNGNHLRKAATI